MALNDSVTLTGENADTIEGKLNDQVRFTVVGKITRMAIEPDYSSPLPTTDSGSPDKKPKKTSSVTISEIEVEDCESAGETSDDSEDDSGDNSGMPKAVKMMASKM